MEKASKKGGTIGSDGELSVMNRSSYATSHGAPFSTTVDKFLIVAKKSALPDPFYNDEYMELWLEVPEYIKLLAAERSRARQDLAKLAGALGAGALAGMLALARFVV